jgi:hypothetical protein
MKWFYEGSVRNVGLNKFFPRHNLRRKREPNAVAYQRISPHPAAVCRGNGFVRGEGTGPRRSVLAHRCRMLLPNVFAA